jgi:hypothetical protein
MRLRAEVSSLMPRMPSSQFAGFIRRQRRHADAVG